MTDEIFRSMKAQMEPSDDVVAELMAKINAERASRFNESENVIPFAKAAELRTAEPADNAAAAAALLADLESAPRKEFANTSAGTSKKKKSIWYYGTAVAASIIVMISTFTLLDPGEEGDGVGDLITDVIGDNSTIVNPVDPKSGTEHDGEGTATPDGTVDGTPDGDGSSQDAEGGQQAADGQDGSTDSEGSAEGGQSGNTEDGDSHGQSGDSSQESDQDPYGEQNWDDPDAQGSSGQSGQQGQTGNSANTGIGQSGNIGNSSSSGNGQTGQSGSTGTDSGKVTPGAVGSGSIAWTNELKNVSQVASISVSGSNYVVGSTVSRSEVGSTLETVTIDLPQTSSTNAAQVTAKVCELKNVSSDAAVALDVEGFTQPLIYANADYSPATLGQLVTDLGLEGNTVFSNSVSCQITRVGYSSNQNYSADVNTAAWMYLLSQSGGERSSSGSFNSGTSKALFISTSNPTGSQIKFGLSDSGCLQVTMLGKVYYFNVGADNAKYFLEFVTGETLG